MALQLADKLALVVGATRGIGRAAALAMGKAGAAVIASGRTLESAQQVSAEIMAAGGVSHPCVLDVTNTESTQGAIQQLAVQFGRLDVLVANAGISPYWKQSQTVTPAMWDEVMQVNLRGLFFAVQAAGRQMLTQGSGSIISISSVTAFVGVPRGLPYVASKGGVEAMTRSLAVEWAPKGVRVNSVAPGYFETDLTQGLRDNAGLSGALLRTIPMGRFGKPSELGGIIVFLASDEASYVTGQTFIVDGGFGAGRALV
jgi:NAD(P)-dependent dehydrogenase (short-subunit alcohol dehydrogenase family)